MQRIQTTPRKNWQQLVESKGMHYHTLNDVPYWDESAYYDFTAGEIDEIEECTYWLNQYCLQAVQHIIDNNLFDKVGIPETHIDYVKNSWEKDEHTIYGRFDLCYDGINPPKLLEYNADTPTGLLEAAVIQWYWLQDCHEGCDQYNSIHDKLLAIFKELHKKHDGTFYFAALKDNLEDYMTVQYLRDVAIQAGWNTEYVNMEDIGWHPVREQFTHTNENTIRNIFKLYPWEWMMREQFANELLLGTANWFEAPWKAILSNKGILPILYEMFPKNKYILPAHFEPVGNSYAKKPIHAREGANIEIVENGKVILSTSGDYEGPYIYQSLCKLPCFDGNYPVIGSWLVNGWASGIGIREDTKLVTQNTSRFIPHIFG